ncbi:MAG: ABC transporter permease [Myxococcales bacterium]|nr:ABC transporter permease [Myxococcales bacterium]
MGPNLAALAWRNLWRNRRRTLITLGSIAFGVLLAVVMTGSADWRWREVINLVARMGGGHVTIQHPDYQERPALSRTVTLDPAAQARLQAVPGVEAWSMRVMGQAMLSTARDSAGTMFLAFDPTRETPETLSVLSNLMEGELFEGPDDKGIILGDGLADVLGVGLGKKVVYTMTHKNGDIVTGLARVTGLVHTGSPTTDTSLCLLPLGAVRKVLGYGPDEGTHVAVFVGDHRRAAAVAAAAGSALGPKVSALTWAQAQPDLAGFITMKVNGMVVMELFMMVLIAAGIFNTMFVSVMERLREFGVMLAVGASPLTVFRLVIWESALMGMAGIVLGAVITAWPYHYLATTGLDLSAKLGDSDLEVAGAAIEPVLKVALYPENALFIAVAIVLATMASGLYPAFRAGRVSPVETIKLI